MTRAGWVASGAIAVAAIVLINTSAPVVSALFRSAETAPAKGDEAKQAADRFKTSTETQVASIKGRSLFFIPPPKPRTRVDPPPRVADKPPEPTKPTVPTRYGGPSIQAVVNGTVWFSDGKKVAIGESAGTGSSMVTVLAAETPWAIRVKWEGVDFDVPLFERDAVIYPVKKADSPTEPKVEPKTEDKATAKPDDKPAPKIELKPGSPPQVKPAEVPAPKPADSTGAPDKIETQTPAGQRAAESNAPSDEPTPSAEPAKKKDEATQ